MAMLMLTSSNLGGYSTRTHGNEQPKLNPDQRASVNTWTSTRYTPSVLTFNANWAPAPLSPLRFSNYNTRSSGSAFAWTPISPSTSAFGASRRWSCETYRQSGVGIGIGQTARLQTGAAEQCDECDGCDDEGERVSHLDFDSDSDGDDREGIKVEQEEDGPNRRRLEDRRHFDSDRAIDQSDKPTPTRAHTDFAWPLDSGRRSSQPQSDSNAALRAYLAGYGFPDGLGYESPPSDNSPRSSPSSSSRYSSYDEDNPDVSYNAIHPGNSEFASASLSNYSRRSHLNTQTVPSHRKSRSELPPLSPSPWSISFEALSALLSSLELDSPLRDDPCGTWEALCWDEVAPEDDSDTASEGDCGEDRTEKKGVRNENPANMSEDWAFAPPSLQNPVFRRVDLTELGTEAGVEDRDDIDSQTISHDVLNNDDNDNDDDNEETGRAISPSTSTRTSTMTSRFSDEWIALTAARAQAARARILPYRQIRDPYPTYPQEDVPVLQDTAHAPVDPVLAGLPPALPVSADLESGMNIRNSEIMVGRDGEGMAEVLAAADGVSMNEGETAPRYGECCRDQLVTIAERDPPPYDLAYESTSGFASFSGPELEVRQGESARQSGEAEGTRYGSNDDGSVPVPQTSLSSSFTNLHPSLLAYAHTPGARSRLSFPTSPTESDTHATMTSPTSFSNDISPYSASPTSPSETTLTTPGGTYFSTLFPHPVQEQSFTDSMHAVSQYTKAQLNSIQGDNVGVNRPESPPYPSPLGDYIVSTPPSTAQGRPRPLPPRPVGAIPRTTAEAWFIASAAGPYADGRTIRDPPASAFPLPPKFGSRSTLGYGHGSGSSEGHSGGSSENGLGSSSGANLGWRSSPAHVSNFGSMGSHSAETLGGPNNGGAGFGTRRASQETVTRPGSDESGGSPSTSLEYLRPAHAHPQILRHRAITLVNANTNTYSARSHSTDSLTLPRRSEEKLKDILGLSSLSSLGSLEEYSNYNYKSASETAFHVIPPNSVRIKAEADNAVAAVGVGLQNRQQRRKHGRNSSSSGGSGGGGGGGGGGVVKPLQRLATRYSTFTRRIGIATGAGSGKER